MTILCYTFKFESYTYNNLAHDNNLMSWRRQSVYIYCMVSAWDRRASHFPIVTKPPYLFIYLIYMLLFFILWHYTILTTFKFKHTCYSPLFVVVLFNISNMKKKLYTPFTKKKMFNYWLKLCICYIRSIIFRSKILYHTRELKEKKNQKK